MKYMDPFEKTSWYFMESVFGRGTFWTVSRHKKRRPNSISPSSKVWSTILRRTAAWSKQGVAVWDGLFRSAKKKVLRSLCKSWEVKAWRLGKGVLCYKQQDVLETKLKLEVTWALEKTCALENDCSLSLPGANAIASSQWDLYVQVTIRKW